LAARELTAVPLPPGWRDLRERFRIGALNFAPENNLLFVAPIFRGGGRPFGGRGARDGPPRGPRSERDGGGPGAPAEGATIIELDREAILKDIVPALVEKHFSSHDQTAFRIAIVAESPTDNVLYSTAGIWSAQDIAKPDAEVPLFGPPRQAGGGRGGGRGTGVRGQGTLVNQSWKLLVKHRLGSLELAVEQARTRNLAAAFGILLVLAAGLITVVISSQRAHTLGKQQMEFAAGVSHELRTPLAVIRSAAFNLRSGIVHDKQEVEEYAQIVQEEARRLSDMVEEVLLYSETQSGRKKYKLEPVDVNEVIDRALTNLSPALALEQYDLSTQIDADLPPVKADASALAQCLQNLLSNAYKYGKKGDKVQIDIEARLDRPANEVRLSVTDHGRGIDSADRKQLFEPFYRGRNVGSSLPGNGLGLHLVKRIMQAQGGRVTFASPPEGGASFTLHLPLAP
jgi:signal transduction histidine kinase